MISHHFSSTFLIISYDFLTFPLAISCQDFPYEMQDLLDEQARGVEDCEPKMLPHFSLIAIHCDPTIFHIISYHFIIFHDISPFFPIRSF